MHRIAELGAEITKSKKELAEAHNHRTQFEGLLTEEAAGWEKKVRDARNSSDRETTSLKLQMAR